MKELTQRYCRRRYGGLNIFQEIRSCTKDRKLFEVNVSLRPPNMMMTIKTFYLLRKESEIWYGCYNEMSEWWWSLARQFCDTNLLWVELEGWRSIIMVKTFLIYHCSNDRVPSSAVVLYVIPSDPLKYSTPGFPELAHLRSRPYFRTCTLHSQPRGPG